MPKFIDLTGQRFGRWLVIKRVGTNNHGSPTWKARCDCGIVKIINGMALRQGASKSCGCYNKDVHREVCLKRNTTHGLVHSKAYHTWVNMRQRCENPKATAYKKYGAKGITVCERWKTFENFYADIGEPPSPLHTIERKDPKGEYAPGNCRWATQKEQQNNRSNNHRITHGGETKTLNQWAAHIGINRSSLTRRIKNWGVERAISTPAP